MNSNMMKSASRQKSTQKRMRETKNHEGMKMIWGWCDDDDAMIRLKLNL